MTRNFPGPSKSGNKGDILKTGECGVAWELKRKKWVYVIWMCHSGVVKVAPMGLLQSDSHLIKKLSVYNQEISSPNQEDSLKIAFRNLQTRLISVQINGFSSFKGIDTWYGRVV